MSSSQAKLFWEALGQERGMHQCLNFASSTLLGFQLLWQAHIEKLARKQEGAKRENYFRVKRYKEGGE